MPIYEYVCSRCGKRVEVFQKVNDPPLRTCKACGGRLKKVLSAPAIQFKGNGWYITDYARRAPAEKEKKPSPETATQKSTSTEGSGQSPPASKNED